MTTALPNKSINEVRVRQLVENWAAAVRNRDIDGILAHHSKDIVMYDVPAPFQSTGIAAYRNTWDMFFAFTKPGVFDIQELHITADENVAFCFARMICEDKSKGGEYIPLDFRLTIGLKKINDQWTIIHEHHSVPAI
jgi:ketosteroid isomerase-like protein